MSHAERIELLAALVRAGATYYKSHDVEIRLGGKCQPAPELAPGPLSGPQATPPAQSIQNDAATERLKELIGTLGLSNEQLVDKIFPAGAGGM